MVKAPANVSVHSPAGQAAQTAIFNRLQAISQNSDHTAERQAIEDADWEKKRVSSSRVVEQSASLHYHTREVFRL